jgi:hypothetical protein
LRPFLSLGPTPLANSFLGADQDFKNEKYFPLDVYFCQDCSLVQLLDVINPEVLFRDYIYISGTSETIASHQAAYSKKVVSYLNLTPADLVVEIASNDGSLLRAFQKYAVKTLGIEPARNLARIANEAGVETLDVFFDSSTAREVVDRFGRAKAVVANNVLAHVDEPRDLLEGCRQLLSKDGLVIIEVPYIVDMLEHLEYDTIYHEHLCYFSVATFKQLCEMAGLTLINVERVPVHGGSLRLYAGARDRFGQAPEVIESIIHSEQETGLHDFASYERFALAVRQNREILRSLLESLNAQGKSIVGYGAPAKGNTLLNYCQIGTQLIHYTVDKNPLKVGKFTPGMHIPVLPVESLILNQPDYVLILAWNFATEIIRQQQVYQERGGKFIIPIPTPEVIE